MTVALSRLNRAFSRVVPLRTTLFFSALFPLSSGATEVAHPAYTPPPPAVSSGSILQIVFSLLLVLAAILLVAWLLKRMNMVQQGSGHHIKVLGGISVGQRERIVLVEIKDTWLVVGVGPGQLRTLHTLQKTEDSGQKSEEPATSVQSSENKFAGLLSSILKSRGAGNK